MTADGRQPICQTDTYYFYRPQTKFGARQYFQKRVSRILSTRGGGVPVQVHPPGPGTPPCDQVHPQTRYTSQDQVHPPAPGTPLGTRYTPLPDQVHPPPGSSACREIRATSGRYASYWNAFLLKIEFSGKKQKKNRFTQNNFFLLKIQQFLGVISVQC